MVAMWNIIFRNAPNVHFLQCLSDSAAGRASSQDARDSGQLPGVYLHWLLHPCYCSNLDCLDHCGVDPPSNKI